MKINSLIFFFIIISCTKEYEYKNNYSVYEEKLNYKLDSVRKSILDSIKKSDSLKVQIGTVKLKKKKIKLFDNFTWEYKNKSSSNNEIKPIYFYSKKTFIPSEICGALTKKRKFCKRKVKGGGRCWQHR